MDVVNDTDVPEFVHWHGLLVPSEVDGAEEEGTPMVPPHGRRRYPVHPAPGRHALVSHTPWPDWTCTEAHTPDSTGFLMVESGNNPGNYDQEVFLALRDWEPFFTAQGENEAAEAGPGIRRPEPERPATLDTRPNGLEVGSQVFSINDKSLGAGEPIRVRPGTRVLMHLLNASAIENSHHRASRPQV